MPNFKDNLMSGIVCLTLGCSGVMNDVENAESDTIYCTSSCGSHEKRPGLLLTFHYYTCITVYTPIHV